MASLLAAFKNYPPDRYLSRKFYDKEIYVVRNTGKSLVFDLESSCYFTVWLYQEVKER